VKNNSIATRTIDPLYTAQGHLTLPPVNGFTTN
jgi:hypothetical protein